jgi:hypothetical protein
MIVADPPIQGNHQAAREGIASEPLEGMTLERFQALMDWAAALPQIPPDFANAFRAASWLAEVGVFRNHEEALVSDGSYRPYLFGLIAAGERFVWAANGLGIPTDKLPFPFTLEDLQATLDSLHTTFRCEYGQQNSEKTNKLIQQLFNVPQP